MVGSDEDARTPTVAVDPNRTHAASQTARAGGPREDEPVAMPRAVGRYQLTARLGSGAMGVVWSATDPQLERSVAIKVVHPRLATAPEASLRMLREARAMAKLSHRAVVTVYDAGEVDGQLFIAMELIAGETLTARLRRPDLARPEAWRQRLALVLEAGRGLAAAHAAGVLHRDFKPDNVLVAESGRVCVGDFGLAALGDGRERPRRVTGELTLTTTGALLGTPVYMSPQQLRGEPADALGDQFALAVAAHEALYGTRPFAVDTTAGLAALPALIGDIEAGRLVAPPASSLVPPAVAEVLRRALAADPAARWPDVAALVAALDAASGLRTRRRRRVALAMAAVVAIAAAAGAGALLYARTTPPGHAEKRSLFRVPLDGAIALGPGGRAIAVGFDHIEVYEDGRKQPWTVALPAIEDRVFGLALDGDTVAYSTQYGGQREVWHYRAAEPLVSHPRLPRLWIASVSGGELEVESGPMRVHALSFVRDGQVQHTWPVTVDEERTLVPSPDGTRFAYLDSAQQTIVVEALGGGELRSVKIESPTALAWSDDAHLLVARGTLLEPTISELALGPDGLGPPRELYRQASGWFMRLAARDGRIVFVDASPVTRVRLFGHDAAGRPANRDHEPTKVSAELGWAETGELVVWNRSTQRVSFATPDGTRRDLAFQLASEPINATRAGDVLVAALRAEGDRTLEAYDLRTGKQLWRAAHAFDAVRCVEDRAPPCVALRLATSEILDVDPRTGVLGAVRAKVPELSDVALARDGHLWAATNSQQVHELAADGHELAAYATGLATHRSIAVGADGRVIVAGTLTATTYAVGELRAGAFAAEMTTDNELLVLARPSADGAQIAVIGRTFSTELSELLLP